MSLGVISLVLVFARRFQLLTLALSLIAVASLAVLARWNVLHDPAAIELLETLPVGEVVFSTTSDPSTVATQGFQSLSFGEETRLRAESVAIGERSISLPMFVSFPGQLVGIEIGSTWKCTASMRIADGTVNFLAYVRCRDQPTLLRAAPVHQHWASILRDSLLQLSAGRHPSVDGATLLPGLVLGDTSAQSQELEKSLRTAGLGHLTAVSGANVAIVVGGVGFLLGLTSISRRSRFMVLVGTVIGFMIVVRPSASVVRASAMAIIALVLWLVGRRKNAESIILASAILLLLIDPWLALSWGFALSVAATLGLVLLPPLWGVDQSTSLWKRALFTATAAAAATTPVLIAMGAAPTLGTIPANVLADAFVAPATIAGVAAALLNVAHIDLVSELLADFAIVMAQAIVMISHTVSESILATPMVSWHGALLACVFIAIWRQKAFPHRMFFIGVGGLLILVLGSRVATSTWPIADWELLVCDVGQGDAALIATGPASAIVIDSGGDAESIDGCLDRAGIKKVDLFVASHFHQDHVGGFAGVVRGRMVERVITSAFAQPPMGLELIRGSVDVRAEAAYAGMSGVAPGVRWQVLSATVPDYSQGSEVNGTAINSSSVVLLVQTRHWQILFTGDLETAAQEELMTHLGSLDVDLVKVPHHGSRFQAEGFAQWVGAEAAWVSVGADNPYRHPNRETLNRFRRAGMQVLTTMDCGAIAATARHTLVTERRCLVG